MNDTTKSMLTAFDYVWQRFTDRIAGMTDDEYLWEPVAACWSLRRQSDGRWTLDGGGGGGPAPDPVPVTTIAWRIGHLAGGLGIVTARQFGPDTLTAEGIDFPSTVSELSPFLSDQYESWRNGIAALEEEDWQRQLGPAWGPYAEGTVLDLVLHMLDETAHHAAEVGLLRDLYQHRVELGR